MTEHDNPYQPPEPLWESSPDDEVKRSWVRQQPLAWKISSAIGIVFAFAGCWAAPKHLGFSTPATVLAAGGWFSLCLLPSAFFVQPRYPNSRVRSWLHALTPSLVVPIWSVIAAVAHWLGGGELAELAFLMASLATTLISAKLSPSKKESGNDAR